MQYPIKLTNPEARLSKEILDKAIKSGNEYGWSKNDFITVVEFARKNIIAIIGGQVQYLFADATYELYWLSYDPDQRQKNEDWITYCNRTTVECSEKFETLITTKNIEAEALESEFIKSKKDQGIEINNHLTFVLYFNDEETDLFKQ